MKKYRVYAKVSGSKYLGEYEARSPEEAEQLALESDEGAISLCHQCVEQCEDAEVVEVVVEVVDTVRTAKGDPPASQSASFARWDTTGAVVIQRSGWSDAVRSKGERRHDDTQRRSTGRRSDGAMD